VINTLVTRQIEIERAKAYIEEHVRYTYACAQCRDGSQMQTTAKPPTPHNIPAQAPTKRGKVHLFGYAGDAEHRFLFYDYRASRSRAGPAEILANYQGVLLSDGFSGYEALVQESQERLRAAACWMHARREFDEARATTSHPLVEETLARIRLLYDLEDRAKSLPHEERRILREREAGPLVERIFASLEAEAGQRPLGHTGGLFVAPDSPATFCRTFAQSPDTLSLSAGVAEIASYCVAPRCSTRA
jgi:hypothetical protein